VFNDQLTPNLSIWKAPSPAELGLAKWAIGSMEVGLRDGRVWPNGRAPDSRTAVAIDRPRKLLFLAIGEYISPRFLLQKVADLGAKDGMLLDGGGSTSMAIGQGAVGVVPGVLYGGWRPVATHFGVRAQRKLSARVWPEARVFARPVPIQAVVPSRTTPAPTHDQAQTQRP
jgi:hypothetical protein